MSQNQYTQAPPAYAQQGASKPNNYFGSEEEGREPLLGGSRSPAPAPGPSTGAGFYDQYDGDDVPDDFKYGVTVSESSAQIRNAFVRKVYSILFCQILATTIVSGGLASSQPALTWVRNNPWSFYVPLFGTLINLGLLFWKRHSHPLNLALLSSFTVLEAFTLGVVCSMYKTEVILEALIITLAVFLGLTLFTFQSKYDFSGMGPWLFAGLIALFATGLIGMFVGFSSTMDLLFAIGGTLLFSGYIVYDTYMINKRLSPDEYIMGAISLYLDFINLFLNILRILNNVQSE